jgi:hypothetical protein
MGVCGDLLHNYLEEHCLRNYPSDLNLESYRDDRLRIFHDEQDLWLLRVLRLLLDRAFERVSG